MHCGMIMLQFANQEFLHLWPVTARIAGFDTMAVPIVWTIISIGGIGLTVFGVGELVRLNKGKP